MEQVIHFETTIERGMIRIPEQFIQIVPTTVRVTLTPIKEPRIEAGCRSGVGALSINDFMALSIDTRNWEFSREEANERR